MIEILNCGETDLLLISNSIFAILFCLTEINTCDAAIKTVMIAKKTVRITSYNVCYTKLLRPNYIICK